MANPNAVVLPVDGDKGGAEEGELSPVALPRRPSIAGLSLGLSQKRLSADFADFDQADVTLEDGGMHLVRSMSKWFIPRNEADELELEDGRSQTRASASSHTAENKMRDITFDTAEQGLKKDLKRQYLAVAIGCWLFLTITQTVSLLTLNYWEYSPVVIGISILALSTIFYWRYLWKVLQLPFKRLWRTPYPFAIISAALGSLAQHAMFLVHEGYDIGQLLIVFFLIQAFYIILVASTFRNYIAKWQRFLNHRKLCFEAMQMGIEKSHIARR
mmetsp:Transcript_5048/g.9014  ORF Transcript_5048/g.9014 Transcript_5048/m.9014 type:complete len:272 (-) Transcript_5048:1361-2176(-)